MRNARLLVVQVFSGRSASNSLFDNSPLGCDWGSEAGSTQKKTFHDFFVGLKNRGDSELVKRVVRETRDDYVTSMIELAHAVDVPAVLLWFSVRGPEYVTNFERMFGIMNEFPQMVDSEVIARIRPAFDEYVECVSSAGLPQRLWRSATPVDGSVLRDDGYLWNEYYPSPEMHERAAGLLAPVCRRFLGTTDPDTRRSFHA